MWLRDACGGEKDVEKERDPPRRQVETRASKGRRFSMGGEWQSLDFVPVLRRGDDSKHTRYSTTQEFENLNSIPSTLSPLALQHEKGCSSEQTFIPSIQSPHQSISFTRAIVALPAWKGQIDR